MLEKAHGYFKSHIPLIGDRLLTASLVRLMRPGDTAQPQTASQLRGAFSVDDSRKQVAITRHSEVLRCAALVPECCSRARKLSRRELYTNLMPDCRLEVSLHPERPAPTNSVNFFRGFSRSQSKC
jgi:hypothetical protein